MPSRLTDAVTAEPAATYRSSVEDELLAVLDAARTDLGDVPLGSLAIFEELERLVRAGGKRVRPMFCYWGYRAAGGLESPALARVGAAIELFHTAAIVHDDVFDGTTHRRGALVCHRQLASSRAVPLDDARTSAVLVGDLANTLADTLFVNAGFPAEATVRALGHFNRMRVAATTGEFLDLLSAAGGTWGPDEAGGQRASADRSAHVIAALKGGSYTVTGPLLVGSSLAGAPPEMMDSLRAYGEPLGEAFQVRDDILGTFGDPVVTGKDRDADLREGKLTILVAAAYRLSAPMTRRFIERTLGRRTVTSRDTERLRDVIRTSGALAETLELIASLVAAAKRALAAAPLEPNAVTELEELAEFVGGRDA